jgi:hypothetical protein
MIKWVETDKGVKRLFLNELTTSPACEISYKIRHIIFVHQGMTHLPPQDLRKEMSGVVVTNSWDFSAGEVNEREYYCKGIVNNET